MNGEHCGCDKHGDPKGCGLSCGCACQSVVTRIDPTAGWPASALSVPIEPRYDFGLIIYGRPAPQGSKNNFGKHGMAESSEHVVPWREAVRSAASRELERLAVGRPMFDGPVAARVVFTRTKPKSAPKGRLIWPTAAPDVSKVLRATEDALTDAGVWANDSQVVDYDRVAKVFAGCDPEALQIPGVIISIREVR